MSSYRRSYYDSSYSRSKPDTSSKASSSLDKPTPSRYSSLGSSSFRSTYTPSSSSYTRDKSGTRESSNTSSSRYPSSYTDDKPEKQSVLNKYMNKSADKTDNLSTYNRLTVNHAIRSPSRDHSPVYSRNNSQTRNYDEDSKIKASSKDKTRENGVNEREKDIPNKSCKSPSYNTSSYPSFKLYQRPSAYNRQLVKEEPKTESISASRYTTPSRFGSTYRSSLLDKPVITPYSSPSISSNTNMATGSEAKSSSQITDTQEERQQVIKINTETESYNDEVSQVKIKDESSSEDESSDSETVSMISVTVVTRGTSPTPPSSSIYLRSRRADMAKTIEKTISRPKKKSEMIDKEMQSDRLDDSTRTSRYASTRLSASPWSSYMDTRYSSPVSSNRYSSGRYSSYSSRENSSNISSPSIEKTVLPTPETIKKDDTIASIPKPETPPKDTIERPRNSPVRIQSSFLPVASPITTISIMTSDSSSTTRSDESPPRNMHVKEKSNSPYSPHQNGNSGQSSPERCLDQLPPQVPKSESASLSKSNTSLNKSIKSGGKKIVKKIKVKSKDAETKKKTLRKSVSTSSGDSESSVQNEDCENDNATEITTTKKTKIGTKLKLRTTLSKIKKSNESVDSQNNVASDSNDNSDARSPTVSLSRNNSIDTTSTRSSNSTSDEEVEKTNRISESQTIFNDIKYDQSSRTSIDDISLSVDKSMKNSPSPKSNKSDAQPRTEEAKSFLMRALAPVTNLFKMRQETSEKNQWPDNACDSDSQDTSNVASIPTDVDSKSVEKPRIIRHIESGERAWWMDSSEKNSESKRSIAKSSSKSADNSDKKNSTDVNANGFKFNIVKQESGERPWWLDSNGNIPEGVEVKTPSRKGSSDSEQSDKYNVYKIRHIDSGEKDWWLNSDSSPKSAEVDKIPKSVEDPKSEDNFTLNVVRIKHIESGERPWWLSSNQNIPESVEKRPTDDSESESLSEKGEDKPNEVAEIISNGVSAVPGFPIDLQDDDDEEPLGDRRSPEGLETPHDCENFAGRTSPYENVECNRLQAGKLKKNMAPFISRHMDIDDILGTSGQLFSPMMDRILSRKTGREIVEGDNSECREIDPREVRIHDSTAQRPVIQKLRDRSDIIDCRDEAETLNNLDDSALQVYKDGDYGPYLDLESSLSEQQEELEGFHKNRKNYIVLRTQLSVRVHAIREKLLNSDGRELRRALFSLKQIFQEDKDLVHEFVQNDGLDCLIRVGSGADQYYQNYILRALGQVMLYVDGMNGVMKHNASLQWLYSLIGSKFRLVVKTTLKLLLVFVEYVDTNCLLLIKAIDAVDCCQGLPPWINIMNLLKDYDASDTELLIYATTLINNCLNGIPDQDTYYNQTDCLEEQGIYNIVQRYMSKQGTDLDLLRQFQIYEAVLAHEDGNENGTSLRQLDDSIRQKLRHRKLVEDSKQGRKSRRYYSGLTSGVTNGNSCDSATRYNQDLLQSALADEEDDQPLTPQPIKSNESYRDNKGHQMYTSGLQQRIQNGTLGHSGSKDMTLAVNCINKQMDEMDLLESPKGNGKADLGQWMRRFNQNGDTSYEEPKIISEDPLNLKKPMLMIDKESTVKDITEKLCSPCAIRNQIEDGKVNLVENMTGVISKAMKGLAKSKSKSIVRSPTIEISNKGEAKKTESDFSWDSIIASLDRPLRLKDLDFTDLSAQNEENLSNNSRSDGWIPPPPPIFMSNNIPDHVPPPPPGCIPLPPHFSAPPQLLSQENSSTISPEYHNKSKKTIKLFWREINEVKKLPSAEPTSIWDEIVPVKIESKILEHLFESRTKDVIKDQLEINKNKEVIVLDHKRSNAINILLKKLPPPQAIKNAIIKMDVTVLTREGIDKLIAMLPSEEETVKIQEAQVSNPSIPLGNAEQFLLTLSSISELNARLKLWVFKLDFESIENEIAEPYMDFKLAMEILRKNHTFKKIISAILSTGNFLNSSDAKGFQLEYLSKIHEVKDTVHKHSLLHHLCHIILDQFPETTDLYSEIGTVTRASKVNFEELSANIERLEIDCKASTNYLKEILKHDNNLMKAKLGDFLHDCAERIIILSIIKKRLYHRYTEFLSWLGIPFHRMVETRPSDIFKVISEFALEYRTTRERVLEQRARKACHRERNKTRGKMIMDVGILLGPETADNQLKSILNSQDSTIHSALNRKRKDPENIDKSNKNNQSGGIEEAFNSMLTVKISPDKKSDHHHKRYTKSQKGSIKRSRTRDGIHNDLRLDSTL